MQLLTTSESQLELSQALRQMHDALDILDELHRPFEIASHLDLAICRLEQALATGPYAQTSVQALISQLENALTTESSTADVQAAVVNSNQFENVCAWYTHQGSWP